MCFVARLLFIGIVLIRVTMSDVTLHVFSTCRYLVHFDYLEYAKWFLGIHDNCRSDSCRDICMQFSERSVLWDASLKS